MPEESDLIKTCFPGDLSGSGTLDAVAGEGVGSGIQESLPGVLDRGMKEAPVTWLEAGFLHASTYLQSSLYASRYLHVFTPSFFSFPSR